MRLHLLQRERAGTRPGVDEDLADRLVGDADGLPEELFDEPVFAVVVQDNMVINKYAL